MDIVRTESGHDPFELSSLRTIEFKINYMNDPHTDLDFGNMCF